MNSATESITETGFIELLTRGFFRSPLQLNRLQSADAELLTLPGQHSGTLAVTVDSISEEILSGLYQNPELIGWMTVMASLSDLAAVGAQPLGMVISEVFPESFREDMIDALQSGIREALTASETFLLGGDTNTGSSLMMTGCAIGIIDGIPITRMGALAGEVLFCSGPAGCGNGFALAQFLTDQGRFQYRPKARLNEGAIVRRFASCCMDTSDGVIATLDQLMRLNNVGFRIEKKSEQILDERSFNLARNAGIPPWLLLAGQHGEFELVFTIPPAEEDQFLSAASSIGWRPLRLGSVISPKEIQLTIEGALTSIDSGYLRNLACGQTLSENSTHDYIQAMLTYAATIQKGQAHHATEPTI